MSNLLNTGKPKKRLLERGAKIEPQQQFNLNDIEATKEEPKATKEEPKATKKVETKAPKKRRSSENITSVRVTKGTRNKLNALIQMGKADNVDLMIDILLDEYIENTLVKDEKKTYGIVLDIINKRDS